MEEHRCVFCGLPEDGYSKYDFTGNKTDMSYRNYSLWPSESADRPKKVAEPYDYVEYITPEWLKEEVKRLFFQPMPTGNSPWPSQHSVHNSLGNQKPAATGAMNGELRYDGGRVNISRNSSSVPALSFATAMSRPVQVLRNTTQSSPPPHSLILHGWNKVVSNGKHVTILIDDVKYKAGEEYSSSPEENDFIATDSGITVNGGSWCKFCYKNGETMSFVTSHNLHDPVTKVVQCPVLRAHRCESCQATGDFAHTRTYCPLVRTLEGNVCSTTIALKSTKRQANGKIRAAKPLQTTAIVVKKKKKCSPCTITESFRYLTAH